MSYIMRKWLFSTFIIACIAVDERFELPVPVGTIAFKAIAIDRSANPPIIQLNATPYGLLYRISSLSALFGPIRALTAWRVELWPRSDSN